MHIVASMNLPQLSIKCNSVSVSQEHLSGGNINDPNLRTNFWKEDIEFIC